VRRGAAPSNTAGQVSDGRTRKGAEAQKSSACVKTRNGVEIIEERRNGSDPVGVRRGGYPRSTTFLDGCGGGIQHQTPTPGEGGENPGGPIW